MSYTMFILINSRFKFGICRILTETAWAGLSNQGFTLHFLMLFIVKAPGMTVAEVGDRAKVKEGCD
jgi:hypothetical protein